MKSDLKSPCSNYLLTFFCKVRPPLRINCPTDQKKKSTQRPNCHFSIVMHSQVKVHFEMEGIILVLQYVLNNHCISARAGNGFHCCCNIEAQSNIHGFFTGGLWKRSWTFLLLFLIKSISQLHISAIPCMAPSALTGLRESRK